MSFFSNVKPEMQQPLKPERPALEFLNVSKTYRLYGRPEDRLLDHMGLTRFMFWKKAGERQQLFHALQNVNISIAKGERVGIIGRNGAGKTTLLKLITENFTPTTGTLTVNGTVQALMQLGIGFHVEFSGYENIRSALHYNGLAGAEFERALEDVIDFVELGSYLHQPMKTYSLGMGARVQFATATAIRPDILIIDEIMGAGDAYFSAKSAHRMEQLTASGCTLLLVSHSSAQVLQFCERCIFMHEGKVREDGPALEVVKSYEEYIADLTQREKARVANLIAGTSATLGEVPATDQRDFATPGWQQEQAVPLLMDAPDVASAVAKNRVSRWAAETGLKVARVDVVNDRGESSGTLQAGRPCSIDVELFAERDGDFTARIAILIMSLSGVGITRLLSDEYQLSMKNAERRNVRVQIESLLLAQGEFVFSVALFKHFDPDDTSTAVRYDLLSRSFQINVVPVHRAEPALINMPAKWIFPSE